MRLLTPPSLAIGLSLVTSGSIATEQPSAESLVGESYVGAHAIHIRTDNDRLFTADSFSSIDHGTGMGAEFGYRVSPSYEARISYSYMNIVTDNKGYDVPTGSSTALDLLYFPYQSSFYVVAGADFLDVEKSNLSGDLGAGYRHYVSDNAALYVEGKGHYQFDNNYTDFSTKIGFIYYFGKKSPSKTHTKPTPKMEKVAYQPVIKDADNDGVIDKNDQCMNTPANYQVDAQGCTVFLNKQASVNLLVNFANNESTIADGNMADIAKVADFMKTYAKTKLTIHGHTSSQGKAEYNQALSQKRAQAVVDVLVNKFAIDASRLTAVGHGESQLLDQANTAKAHAKNRRIEATITQNKKVPATR